MTENEVLDKLKVDPSFILKIEKTEWCSNINIMLWVARNMPNAFYMGSPAIKDNPVIVRAMLQTLIDSREDDFKILQAIQNHCSPRIEEYLAEFNTNGFIKALDSLILQQELEEKLPNDKPRTKLIHN